jgi:hypothetical protein
MTDRVIESGYRIEPTASCRPHKSQPNVYDINKNFERIKAQSTVGKSAFNAMTREGRGCVPG